MSTPSTKKGGVVGVGASDIYKPILKKKQGGPAL
jgi:hypothetical protein